MQQDNECTHTPMLPAKTQPVFTTWINYQSKRELRNVRALIFCRQPDDRLVMPFVRVRGSWVVKHPAASLYFATRGSTAGPC